MQTWVFALTGLRRPVFLGDTVDQSRCRLARWHRNNDLELVQEVPATTFRDLPGFIYHRVRKGAR